MKRKGKETGGNGGIFGEENEKEEGEEEITLTIVAHMPFK
jgi:hypothetical protein